MADGLSGARVLVTGASGFIGSHLTRRLVEDGATVHALTSRVSSLFPSRLADLRERISVHEANLCDRSAAESLVQDVQPQIILHLAAFTHVDKSWRRVDECVSTNVQGTLNLLNALDRVPYRRFVNMGTSEIYGNIEVPFVEDAAVHPASPYAVTKHAGEEFCRLGHTSRGWPIVRVRAFNAYGPAQSPDRIIPEVIVRALRGEVLRMTVGSQTRDFNFVMDLVDALVRVAVVDDLEGQLLNIGSGEEISIADLTLHILGLMGNPIEPKLGALPKRPIEIPRMRSGGTRAQELLGWEPRHTLTEGLRLTIAWYEDELSQRPDSVFVPAVQQDDGSGMA